MHTMLFRIAFASIKRTKRRSVLTMLGVIIGVSSVVLVMSIGKGSQSIILSQIARRGTNQIAILAGASDPTGPPAQALGIVITTLTHEDGLALLKNNAAPHVVAVASYVSGNDTLQYKEFRESVTYTGTTASYAVLENVEMAAGRFFTEDEEIARSRVVVLGHTIAEEIFGNQDPVGQVIKIQRKNFTVVGVMVPQGSSGFEDPDSAVLIPIGVAQKELLGISHVSFLRATVRSDEYLDASVEDIRQTLLDRHGTEDFSVRKFSDVLALVTTITNAIRFFLVAVAAVALFVGGVGIMNIMLISVREKTREIGLRKSVGATHRAILLQFLYETLLLSSIAGIIGILIGSILSFGIARVVQFLGYGYVFSISLPSVGISFGVALLVGLLFGVVPARTAARLHPIDALRYE